MATSMHMQSIIIAISTIYARMWKKVDELLKGHLAFEVVELLSLN